MTNLTKRKYWDTKYSKIQKNIYETYSKGSRLKLILRRIFGVNLTKYTQSYANFLLWEKILKKYLPKKNKLKVLEVGSAPGYFLLKLKKEFNYNIFGVEYSDIGVKLNKELFKLNNINPKNIIHADFLSHEFQIHNQETYDIVISRGFIEHFTNVKEIVEIHKKTLKRNGLLIISIPNFRGFNYILAKIFNKNILLTHNLDIMVRENFLSVFEDNDLFKLFCNYYGTFKFGLVYAKEKSLVKYLINLLDYLQGFLNLIFYFILKKKGLETRIFSPYLIYIGIKIS